MDLEPFRTSFVRELSTGTRRILDLACQIAHRPTVILLDEPSSGIAQREVEALAPVLVRLRDEMGAALVVIEHDIPLVTEISDRLVALDMGRVIATGDPGGRDRPPAGRRVVPRHVECRHQPFRNKGVGACSQRVQEAHAGGGNRALRRWGPIAAIVAVDRHRRRRRSSSPVGRDDDDGDGDTSAESDRRDGSATRRRRRRAALGAAPRRRRARRRAAPTARPRRHRGEITFPLTFSAGRRSRASRATSSGASAATPRPAASPCRTTSPPSATRRSRVTTAAPRHRASPPTRSRSCATSLPRTTRSSTTSPTPSPATTPTTSASRRWRTSCASTDTYYELYGRRIELIPFEGYRLRRPTRSRRAPTRCASPRRSSRSPCSAGPALTHGVRRRAGGPRHHVHRLRAGPADELLRRPRPVRLGHRRQRRAEAGPRRRVRPEAARRQERRVRRRGDGRLDRARSGSCTSSSGPTSAELADRFAGLMEAAGAPLVEVDPVRARPGDDPADRAADDHPAEGGRRDDGALPRRPGRAT